MCFEASVCLRYGRGSEVVTGVISKLMANPTRVQPEHRDFASKVLMMPDTMRALLTIVAAVLAVGSALTSSARRRRLSRH